MTLRSSEGRDRQFTSYSHCLWHGDIVAREELKKVGQGELLVHVGSSFVSRRNSEAVQSDM